MKHLVLLLFGLFTIAHLCAQMDRKEFEFTFDGVKLHGILNSLDQEAKGLVLIIHGSGQTNAVEQEWHYDVRALMVSLGYTTFMWDKMGCGKSGGTFDYNQPVQSSASEVIAAIHALQAAEVNGADVIGLWGTSRAGWINPLVINQFQDIAFWISVSGVDANENFNYLFAENLRIEGFPQDTIDLLLNELKQGAVLCYEGGSYETYMNATTNLRRNAFWRRFSGGESSQEAYRDWQQFAMTQGMDKKSGLMVYVDDFEEILSGINCPVLALFGEKDLNVDWKKTMTLYRQTLGNHTDLTIQTLSDCNHNMFKCNTGGFYEFEDYSLPWDRCDGFLKAMADWLEALD